MQHNGDANAVEYSNATDYRSIKAMLLLIVLNLSQILQTLNILPPIYNING